MTNQSDAGAGLHANAGVIATARALIAADRAQALTTEHVNALENAITTQLAAGGAAQEPGATDISLQQWCEKKEPKVCKPRSISKE